MYLAALLLSIAGMLTLDFRLKLFLFAAPLRAIVVLAVGVGGFLLWDAAGVASGIFFKGASGLLVGVDLAPDIPVVEVFFLLLLCLTAMDAFLLADRTRRNARLPLLARLRPGPHAGPARRGERA